MKLKRIIAYLLLITMILSLGTSCSDKNSSPAISSSPNGFNVNPKDSISVQTAFDLFTEKIFEHVVTSDSLTLNYTLEKPEVYNIKMAEPTLGHITKEKATKDINDQTTFLTELRTYPKQMLTESQQITYEILEYMFDPNINLEDYYYYQEILSSTVGFQAQLPILLAEFEFHNKKSVETYLSLLPTVLTYFQEIAQFEIEKSEEGLFMSNKTADNIIKQCQEFIKDPGNNYLIDIFNDKIKELNYTEKEQLELSRRNEDGVKNYIIPAYQHLIDTLSSLKNTGNNENGLSNYPQGKEYYSYLVANSTGSDKSIEEIDKLFGQAIQNSMLNMMTIAAKNKDVLTAVVNPDYSLTDPVEILDYLQEAIENDFPHLNTVNCNINYVHESLEDFLSPAFFLTPPIDNYQDNHIYINGGEKHDLSQIFTTIAHEAYPGHLYQNAFYNQQQPSLIRNIVDFGGYSEGWATYVELYSYSWAGFQEDVVTVLQENMISTLCLYGKVDIGVNYYGWTLHDTTKFLNGFGITSKDDIETIHQSMVEEPSNYMKYVLGYLEIANLRETAEEKLGEKFNIKDFHDFLLSFGPAPFSIISSHMNTWIDKQLTK